MPSASRSHILLAAWSLGVLFLGLLLGGAWGLQQLPEKIPSVIEDDRRAGVPVVRISGIRDGALTGTMSGDVRLFAGEALVLPDGSGAFHVSDRTLLTNIITVDTPAGMKFVASKRGKKYYPLGSSAGDQIVPGNRVYFPDRAAAEAAGYVR